MDSNLNLRALCFIILFLYIFPIKANFERGLLKIRVKSELKKWWEFWKWTINYQKKEKIRISWKTSTSVQMCIALATLAILFFFSDNSLVTGIAMCSVACWGFGKLFFIKEHKYVVFIMSAWILYKGIIEILSCYKS